MKKFLLGSLKFLWFILRAALIFVGIVGSFLSVLFLFAVAGIFVIFAIVNGGLAAAWDATWQVLLIGVGALLGFSLLRALGMYDHANA